MKIDYAELSLMNITDLCQKCRSIHTHEIKSRSIYAWLLKATGYQMVECKKCGHRWKEFLPMQPLLNLVYLILAIEIIFLISGYFNEIAKMAHYLSDIFS